MLKSAWSLLREVISQWLEDRGQQIGAALAFYSIFSLPAALLIALTIAGEVVGTKADEEQLIPQLANYFGRESAETLVELADKARKATGGPWATAGSVFVLFVSATGAALGMKEALDTVWGVVENPNLAWWRLIGDRLLALLLVFAFGAVLLASMMLTTLLVNMGQQLTDWLPFSIPVARWVNIAVSGLMATLLLAVTFKLLPDVYIRWREVWIGAIVTAVLFMTGKELIGLYLGRVPVTSAYGAAGSLVLIMLWIYYSAQILLLGAEFTQVYAYRSNAPVRPARGAISVTDRRDRDECVRRLRAEKNRRRKQDSSKPADSDSSDPAALQAWKQGGLNAFLWALGGLALGWLIGVWNR